MIAVINKIKRNNQMNQLTEELRDKHGKKINEGFLQKVVDWIVSNKIKKDYQDDPEWLKLKSLAAKIRENQAKFKKLEAEKQKAALALRPQLLDLNERLKDPKYYDWFVSIAKTHGKSPL
jgi:hypothetical protein